MLPVLDEILRASTPIRPDVLRRWQSAIRNELGPYVAALEAQVSAPKKGKREERAA